MTRKKYIYPLFLIIVICAIFFVKKFNAIDHSEKTIMKNSKDNVRLLFVGDLMFDRFICKAVEWYGYEYIYSNVEILLGEKDLVIGNLEGPITNEMSESINTIAGSAKNFKFTFASGTADVLKKMNINLVNIGNNHILDFGSTGLKTTRKYLEESGIRWFGDPEDENRRLCIVNIKGLKIGFVSYNQFIKSGYEKAVIDIKNAFSMNIDVIIVFAHWGIEFASIPDKQIRELAHGLIDNGADIIIGTHPHVIQPKEIYNEKLIYYSLGNFIFDQYFDSKTKKGIAVEVVIDSEKRIKYIEHFISLKSNGQTILVE